MKRNTNKNTSVFPQRSAVATAVSAALLATSLPAHSQQVEEIIVTATKREETLQEVPLAITALTGDFTESVNLDDVKAEPVLQRGALPHLVPLAQDGFPGGWVEKRHDGPGASLRRSGPGPERCCSPGAAGSDGPARDAESWPVDAESDVALIWTTPGAERW